MTKLTGTNQNHLRHFAVLSLVILIWAQAAVASHHLQHSFLVVDNACDVCIQIDKIGDAINSEPSSEVPLPGLQIHEIGSHVNVDSSCYIAYFCRAPPAI